MRTLKPHGTLAAYRRHLRHGEAVCSACATENRTVQTVRRRANGIEERDYLACPSCGHSPFTSAETRRNGTVRCDGCGVTAYRAFPEYRVASKAQQRALMELSHLYPGVYRSLYEKACEQVRTELGL